VNHNKRRLAEFGSRLFCYKNVLGQSIENEENMWQTVYYKVRDLP